MFRFFALSLCLLGRLQAAPIQRFSSLRGQKHEDPTKEKTADMQQNVDKAVTMISFAADRVEYASTVWGTAGGAPKNNIPIDKLKELFPGIDKAYRLHNDAYDPAQLGLDKKATGYNAAKQPGLDQGCDKGKETAACTRGIACGLVNAIFYREWRMSMYSPDKKTFPLKPKSPGNGAFPTKYYLDFLTMKNGHPLHFHDEWEKMWNDAAAKAAAAGGWQVFLIDDAFFTSPNTMFEAKAYSEAKTKPKLVFVFGSPSSSTFKLTDLAKAKKTLATAEWFGADTFKTATLFDSPNQANQWIPPKLTSFLSSRAGLHHCNGKKWGVK